jgi:hypothetical protein
MNRKVKEVYVPPRVTVHRVILEQSLAQAASPVSVVLMNDSIQQDGEWEADVEANPSEGGIWMGF